MIGFSRDLGVDGHLALVTLKRRRDDPGDQGHGAGGGDPVLALAPHEGVDIGLLGLQRDAHPGGRAEGERGVSLRPDSSFVRSETKLRPAYGGPGEIDGDRSRDPPRGRRVLAGGGSCQSGGADETKAVNPGCRVAFERAVEFGGRPALPGVHRDAKQRPLRTRFFRGEPEDNGRIVRAGKLAVQMSRAVEGRRSRVDLDAGNFGRRSIRGANDPHAPVPYDQAVKPGRVEASHAQRRQLKRAASAARDGQNGFLKANVGEPNLAARQLDERKLQPRRGERQLRPVRARRADQPFA